MPTVLDIILATKYLDEAIYMYLLSVTGTNFAVVCTFTFTPVSVYMEQRSFLNFVTS